MKVKVVALVSFVLGFATPQPGQVLFLSPENAEQLINAGLVKAWDGEEEDYVDERLYTGEETVEVEGEATPKEEEETVEVEGEATPKEEEETVEVEGVATPEGEVEAESEETVEDAIEDADKAVKKGKK